MPCRGRPVEYLDCQLFINGDRVAEPYLDPQLVTKIIAAIRKCPCGSSPGMSL